AADTAPAGNASGSARRRSGPESPTTGSEERCGSEAVTSCVRARTRPGGSMEANERGPAEAGAERAQSETLESMTTTALPAMDENGPAVTRGDSVRGIASAHRPVRLNGVPTFSVVIASREPRREL